jgi:hypothetical protein
VVTKTSDVSIEVAATELSELILAVHHAAGPGRRMRPRWKFGNVIGIGGSKVADLPAADACRRHDWPVPPVAAVTITQRHIQVDVLFELNEPTALATFSERTDAESGEPAEVDSFITYLTLGTVRRLSDRGVATSVR